MVAAAMEGRNSIGIELNKNMELTRDNKMDLITIIKARLFGMTEIRDWK